MLLIKQQNPYIKLSHQKYQIFMQDLLFKMKRHQQWLEMRKKSFQQSHKQNTSIKKQLKIFIRQYLRRIEFHITAIEDFEAQLHSDPIIKDMFNFIANQQKKARDIWNCTQQEFLKLLEVSNSEGQKTKYTSEIGNIQQIQQQILVQMQKDLKYYDKLIAIVHKISEKHKQNKNKVKIQQESTQLSLKSKKQSTQQFQQLKVYSNQLISPEKIDNTQAELKVVIKQAPEDRYRTYKQNIRKEMQKQLEKKNYETEPIYRRPVIEQPDNSVREQNYTSKTQPRKKVYSYLDRYQRQMNQRNQNPQREAKKYYIQSIPPVQYELRRGYEDTYIDKDYWKATRIPQYKSIQQRIDQHNRFMETRKANFHTSIQDTLKRFRQRALDMENEFAYSSSRNVRNFHHNKWQPFARQPLAFDRVQQQFKQIRRKLFSPYGDKQNPKIRQKLADYSKKQSTTQQKNQQLDDSLQILKQQTQKKKNDMTNIPSRRINQKNQFKQQQQQKFSSPSFQYQIFRQKHQQFKERPKEKTLESLLEESQLSDANEIKSPYTAIEDSQLQKQLQQNIDQIPLIFRTGKFSPGSSIKLSQIAQFNNSRNSMIEEMLDSLQKAQQFTFGF